LSFPFQPEAGAGSTIEQDMAVLGRAGFPESIVRQVMRLSRAEAALIVERAYGARSQETYADEWHKV